MANVKRARVSPEPPADAAAVSVDVYNPLEPQHLGESVARALEKQPCYRLPPPFPFEGAGIYSIYYIGQSPYYKAVTDLNVSGCSQPIYVGKADPPGRRKGVFVKKPGRVLYNRLRQHAQSISEVEANTDPNDPGHLKLDDFRCRFLVVEQVWIPLIESLSITTHRPAWNGLIDGFGHHDQGSTRVDQEKSFWDTLHPGRVWAQGFRPNRFGAEAIAQILARWLIDPATPTPKRKRERAKLLEQVETERRETIDLEEEKQ